MLQYSHDAGHTWALVREGCFPGSPAVASCKGSGYEFTEPTVYNTGDYERWTRVTVVIPRHVAARYNKTTTNTMISHNIKTTWQILGRPPLCHHKSSDLLKQGFSRWDRVNSSWKGHNGCPDTCAVCLSSR